MFDFVEMDLKGAYRMDNFFVTDMRGTFTKCYEKSVYAENGIEFSPDEVFVTVSCKNVIRGLHFQMYNPQSKVVCVLNGRIWDVIVDLRQESVTYGKWIGTELSAKRHNALYIPRGFAHGFVALEDNSMMLYQCEGKYDKESDTGIRFDDSHIGIKWPINIEQAIVSSKDMALMSFFEYEKKPMQL